MFGAEMMGLVGLDGLGAITTSRNSRLEESSHSDERQETSGEDFVSRFNMIHLGYCEDTNIPGDVDPWDRDELGPWLRGENGDFGAIVATTVDRISRDFEDFCTLRKWCIENGKKLIVIQFGMDLASKEMIPFLVGNILATFAEIEHRMSKKRLAEGRETSLKMRKAIGGQTPYWCQQVPHDSTKGYKWTLHPARSEGAMEMIEHIESGLSRSSLAKRYNDECRPLPRVQATPNGRVAQKKHRNNKGKGYAGRWTATTIKNVLDNAMLIGHRESEEWTNARSRKDRRRIPGTVRTLMEEVSDEFGNVTIAPVRYCEPLLVDSEGNPDVQRFDRLRALLHSNGARRIDAKPLAGVVHCFECGAVTYGAKDDGIPDKWQRCSLRTSPSHKDYGKCTCRAVKTENIKRAILHDFLSVMGDREVCIAVKHPPQDHSKLLAAHNAEYEDLFEMLRTAPKAMREKYAPRMRHLEAEIERLEGLPQTPARTEWLPSGRKLRDLWSAEDWHANGKLLRDLGIKIFAGAPQHEGENISIKYPDDIDARLQALTVLTC